MELAREKLESLGYRVVGGVLAPCHREHILRKGAPAVADEHRFAALRLACEGAKGPAGWLRCDPRGVSFGSGRGMLSRLVEQEVQQEFPGAVGFDVKGADVVVRYQSYRHEAQYPCIVVGRAGATAEVKAGLASQAIAPGADGAAGAGGSGCILIEAELPGDLSSTSLRKALEVGDEAAVESLCPPAVARHLLALGGRLFDEEAPPAAAEATPAGQPDGAAEVAEAVEAAEAAEAAAGRPAKQRRTEEPPAGPQGGEGGPRGGHGGQGEAVAGASGSSAGIRVYFIRHGEARHNVDEEAWRERDPPLTTRGQAQAADLRSHPLLTALSRPLLVAVSPLRRTLQTATLALYPSCAPGAAAAAVRFVANSDLQETTTYPCDLGTSPATTGPDFPHVDFSQLDGSGAWLDKEPPYHHDRWARLQRFERWCARQKVDEMVAVTHQNVLRMLFGVLLDNCDVLGATLNRSSLTWEPLAYAKASPGTLRWTAVKGTAEGARFLLAGPLGGADPGTDLGDGWPMLHYAAGCGNTSVVLGLLSCRADPEQVGSCGHTASHWAADSGWLNTLQVLSAASAPAVTGPTPSAALPPSLGSTEHGPSAG